MSNFATEVGQGIMPNKEENVYNSIFDEYERVVVESLIKSFGLDFIISRNMDQHGGDVDTIHNVRKIADYERIGEKLKKEFDKNGYNEEKAHQIINDELIKELKAGKDLRMTYKNKKNEVDYKNRGKYDYGFYHSGGNFQRIKHQKREKWQETGQNFEDEYTKKEIGFYSRHTVAISPNKKAELDHIIAGKDAHNDRGRVLSGLCGKDLVDAEENLAWTNKSLNASMGDKDIKEYIDSHPELDEETKNRMLQRYDEAKKSYDRKISVEYYTSKRFWADTSTAALKVGAAMGLREVLGLVFAEIWFAVKDEIKKGRETGKALFRNIGNGIKQGLQNAKNKFGELWKKFIDGAIAGVLASLTTTLCNIFFSTAKNLVRIIRQSWASIVEATKILLFNPDNLPFGERFRAASKIIAVGASIIAGTFVGEAISKTGIGAIPIVGNIVTTFVGTLVSGIMSCTLLRMLDQNTILNKIVKVLNSIPTIEDIVIYYKIQAQLLEEYSAKLMDIDLDKFREETEAFYHITIQLENVQNQEEMNDILKKFYKELNFKSPFEGYKDFDSFMNDDNSQLSFC